MRGDQRKLVVFLSGWTGQTFLWRNLKSHFENLGYETSTAIYPRSGYGRIQTSAHTVATYLEKKSSHFDQVVFIGHSMGGVIGAYGIKHGFMKPDAYVSIASPHKGTYVAKYAKYVPFSASAIQMGWESEFCDRNNSCGWPDDVPALALQAAWDEIVLPHSSAEIDFGDNITIPQATHITIPMHQRTFYEIWGWLGTI